MIEGFSMCQIEDTVREASILRARGGPASWSVSWMVLWQSRLIKYAFQFCGGWLKNLNINRWEIPSCSHDLYLSCWLVHRTTCKKTLSYLQLPFSRGFGQGMLGSPRPGLGRCRATMATLMGTWPLWLMSPFMTLLFHLCEKDIVPSVKQSWVLVLLLPLASFMSLSR